MSACLPITLPIPAPPGPLDPGAERERARVLAAALEAALDTEAAWIVCWHGEVRPEAAARLHAAIAAPWIGPDGRPLAVVLGGWDVEGQSPGPCATDSARRAAMAPCDALAMPRARLAAFFARGGFARFDPADDAALPNRRAETYLTANLGAPLLALPLLPSRAP